MDLKNLEINIVDNEEINDEYLLFQHNFLKNNLINAINIVKQYIIEHELLIVGGSAIDFALKLKNNKLYNEVYQIPDFDVISYDNILHANNIGKILCSNKYSNVSIIPAIHNTTVRVQLMGYTVFDSTYVPKYIYDKIPFLTYNNFKFIHPIYQKIDQFLSLSFLFDVTGPNYNIYGRFEKDIERKSILNNFYNIQKSDITIKNEDIKYNPLTLNLHAFNNSEINLIKMYNKDKCIYDKKNISTKEVAKEYDILNTPSNNSDDIFYTIDSDYCYHGVLAYNLIYDNFKKLMDKIKNKNFINEMDLQTIKNLENDILIKTEISIKDNNINLLIPNNIPLIIINNNNNIEKIYEEIKKDINVTELKKFEHILNVVPNFASTRHKLDTNNLDIEFYDLYGKLLSVNMLTMGDNLFVISNYNYNLSYFLFNYYMNEDMELKNIYLSYYLSLNSIIKITNLLYTNYSDIMNDIYPYYNSIYNYSINTLGIDNFSENYYYHLKNYYYLIYNNTNLTDLPPKNYISFPNCDIKKIFDLDKSPFYQQFHKEVDETNYHTEIYKLLELSK